MTQQRGRGGTWPEPPPPPPDPPTFQYAKAATESGAERRGGFLGGAAKPSVEEEKNVRELILAACQVALSGYSTSLEVGSHGFRGPLPHSEC